MELLRSHVFCMSSSVFYFTEPTTVILKKKKDQVWERTELKKYSNCIVPHILTKR